MRHTKLVLGDGTVWTGSGFGSEGQAIGEVAFTTLMGGTAEQLADPRCRGQLLAHTFPVMGNYGVPEGLGAAMPAGIIVRELCKHPSNYRSTGTLEEYLIRHGVVGLAGVDTRQLMRYLRITGPQMGILVPSDMAMEQALGAMAAHRMEKPMTRPIYTLEGGSKRVALLDFSAGEKMAGILHDMGMQVTVYPQDTPAEIILKDKPDGIVFSDGSGDPAQYAAALPAVKALLDSDIPALANGLGFLLMAQAAGGEVQRMLHPHRGANQPVREKRTGRLMITSQYHGYELVQSPPDAAVLYTNLHGDSIEGIRLANGRAIGVQFDLSPQDGPHDPTFILKDFLYSMAEVA